MWRRLLCFGICFALVAGVRAAMNPDVLKVGGVYSIGEQHGPVKRVALEKVRFSFPLGVPVPRTRYRALENEYDRKGQLLLRMSYYGYEKQSGYGTYEYVRDAVGRVIEEVHGSDSFPRSFSIRSTYDDNGNCIEKTGVNNQGDVFSRQRFDYDAHGRCIVDLAMQRDGTVQRTVRYSYEDDEAAKPSEAAYYDQHDQLERRIAYEYTDTGEIASATVRNSVGAVESKTTNTYDDEGDLVRTVTKRGQGGYSSRCNKQGDVVETAVYDNKGKLVVRSVRVYTYDEHGNWTQCVELRTTLLIGGKLIMTPYEFSFQKIEYYEDEDAAPEAKEPQ